MLDYNISDYKILRFFSYTSTIPSDDRTFYYDGMNHNYGYLPNIREKFDDFERELIESAREIWKENTGEDKWITFGDNKIVFQVMNKRTRKVFFIGHYDFYRFIGNSCHLYDGYIYDFENFKCSDYVSDVKCDACGLWKKFEF